MVVLHNARWLAVSSGACIVLVDHCSSYAPTATAEIDSSHLVVQLLAVMGVSHLYVKTSTTAGRLPDGFPLGSPLSESLPSGSPHETTYMAVLSAVQSVCASWLACLFSIVKL
ncbi:hypothetical protein EDC01DRAFT_46672 [Geopyxis carbonaria]|nr:hypothetical protein EDC01DRAFT_46672 [Geopyxis carbonaria]